MSRQVNKVFLGGRKIHMYFRDVIGQSQLKEQLIQVAKTKRFGHALLFLGELGYGGVPIALAFYRYLVCKKQGETDACGMCGSCIKLNNLAHPDLHFFYPVTSNGKVKTKPVSSHFIEEWRELVKKERYFTLNDWVNHLGVEDKQLNISVNDATEIIKKLSLKPYESEFQTIFIWLPEKLNTQAANRILKVLEEPPAGSLFFLIAESADSLLPTILSRLQTIKLKQIKAEEIQPKLASEYSIDFQSAGNIAGLAHGDYNLAKIILKEGGGTFINESFQTWMRICYKIDFLAIMDWVNEIGAIGRERQKLFCKHALNIIRNSLMINYVSDEMVEVFGSDKKFLEKFAPFIHADNAQQLMEEVEQLIYHIERNVNAKMAFMDVSLNVCKLLRIKATMQ